MCAGLFCAWANDDPNKNLSQVFHPFSLIAVRMAVAPIPVVPLLSVVLPVVLTITPVLFRQVTPVGAVFGVVPVMVITVVPIADSDLDTGLLSFGFVHN